LLPSDVVQGIPLANDKGENVAITPDGALALVTVRGYYGDSDAVLVFDLTQTLTTLTGSIPLPSGSSPTGIAISPDGTIAVVVNSENGTVSIIDIVHRQILGSAIPVGTSPAQVAITTDGKTALVTNFDSNTVSVVDLTSMIVIHTISGGGMSSPRGIAVTPDGTKALVGNNSSNSLTIIDLSSLSPTATIAMGAPPYGIAMTIAMGAPPYGIAISPDGTLALVASPNSSAVIAINLENLSIIGSPISVGTSPIGVTITPDGQQAFVADARSPFIYVLDLTQVSQLTDRTAHNVFSTIEVHPQPTWSAITPDQAPTARFNFSVQGSTVYFDGSASTSPVGGIKTYIWDFGDGATQTTSMATVSHTYSGAGPFIVSLTVVNDAGTSLAVTFTGQTVSNNGGPSARNTQVVAGPVQPAKFVGKVHLHHKDKKVKLNTKWRKSSSSNVTEYQIFARNKKIATIKAKHNLEKTLTLHPRHFPKSISKKYRLFLHDKYSIRNVDASGNTSLFTALHVRH
jgi:YVTN family beta-propeller protein